MTSASCGSGRTTRLCGILLIGLLALRCSSSEIKCAEAKAVAEDHFLASEKRDVDGIFEQTPKHQWEQLLQTQYDVLGRIESWELVNWKIDSFVGTGGRQAIAVLQNEVDYERDSALVKLSLTREPDGAIRILGHHLESETFREYLSGMEGSSSSANE